MGFEVTALQAFLLVLLAASGFLAVSGWLRTDLLGLSVLFVLAISGLLTPQEAFVGFSSPAVITLAGLFILTEAMNGAGFVHWLAARVTKWSGRSEAAVTAVFILVGATLSLFVNTAAAGAVLLPAVVSVAGQRKISPSKLLLPMGFGVIVGGAATIFTTANIIMSGLLQSQGHHGLTLMDFFPTGWALVVVTLLYFLAGGSKLLPDISLTQHRGLNSSDLTEIYSMKERMWELEVDGDSPLDGRTLEDIELGVPVLAIWRGKKAEFSPGAESQVHGGDILLVSASRDDFQGFRDSKLTVGRDRQIGERDIPVVMVEAVIPPRSSAVGKTLVDLNFQKRHGLTVVALWRGGESHRDEIGTMALRAGDALLMVGTVQKAVELTKNPDYLVVDTPHNPPLSSSKSALTLLITAGVLAAAGLGLTSMSLAAFSGALLLVLLKVMKPEEAYSAIDWRVLFLIAGMFPMAKAMEKTGLTAVFSDLFSQVFAGQSPIIPVAAVYLFTVLATQIVGGQVSALFTGPVALSMAGEFGIDPKAVAVLVGIACSNCFITSIAHPVNLLVSGPGGYKAKDFVKVGSLLQVLCFLTAMGMAHYYWGIG